MSPDPFNANKSQDIRQNKSISIDMAGDSAVIFALFLFVTRRPNVVQEAVFYGSMICTHWAAKNISSMETVDVSGFSLCWI